MTPNSNDTMFSEQEITAALHRAAQLTREDGIKHGTGIIVSIDGKVVKISAEELKKQAKLNKVSK